MPAHKGAGRRDRDALVFVKIRAAADDLVEAFAPDIDHAYTQKVSVWVRFDRFDLSDYNAFDKLGRVYH